MVVLSRISMNFEEAIFVDGGMERMDVARRLEIDMYSQVVTSVSHRNHTV